MLIRLSILLSVLRASSKALGPEEAQNCDGDGQTINCRSHKEISRLIRSLKQEVYSVQRAVDPNCTVCWSDPCLNNGLCNPLNITHFRCDCPDDYAGLICQTHVQCKSDSCGSNAQCFVKNHQINCVCNPGYTGDPKKGCTMKAVEACMSGDPHYITFDGQQYEYMGTCPYYFAKPCKGSLPSPYSYFEVKAKNELTAPTSHVSVVNEAEVVMYGQRLHVDKAYNFYFNGIRRSMPFYYPNKQNAKINVTYAKSRVTISNDQFIVVKFSYGSLCVQIPDEPLLQGNDVLCGLAGNRDFDCRDDFRNSDGFVYTNVSSCSNRYKKFTEVFGDTYITTDFLPLKSNPEQCLTGVEVTNGSLTCDLTEAKAKCLPIAQAANGTGPFAACRGLGSLAIENAYDNCVFDTCQHPSTLCESFNAFVRTCQTELPNTPITWRSELDCPELHCPLHASPKPCATGCPLSCENPNYSPSCEKGCLEGCECDPGYVLDNVDPKNPKCVQLSECGCADPDGNYHSGDEQWLTDNCTTVNFCANGKYNSYQKPCASDAHCTVDETRSYKCVCDSGFDGDGYVCSDIDECLDPHICSTGLGQGNCTNTFGSYLCTCDVYYNDGNNCEQYLPLRHCADLYVYHNKTSDGVYTLKPPYPLRNMPAFSDASVYCDMTTAGGGWTLMSNSLADSMSNKTYHQYVDGFGNPLTQDLWLGLEFIHQMTLQVNTSLRVDLHRCASRRKPAISTNCTYAEFKVLEAEKGYPVVIPYGCEGTEVNYDEGWARWDSDIGPDFTAFDSENSECSQFFRNTGWWFDKEHHCGAANLNGNRYDCDHAPSASELYHYLQWDANPVNQAHLYLRPAAYPDYEEAKPTEEPVDFTTVFFE